MKNTETNRRAPGASAELAPVTIRAAVETLAAKYPVAGLTFGYIGNVWGADMRFLDDRCWRVFSKFMEEGLWGPQAASWGKYPTSELSTMAERVRTGDLEAWILKKIAIAAAKGGAA